MAIVEMKHVDMLALEKDRHVLLTEIQKLACIQLYPADSESAAFSRVTAEQELPALEEQITRVAWAIGKLHRFDTAKKPFMGDIPTITEAQARAVMERRQGLFAVVEKLELMEREAGELRGQAARADAAQELLAPWRTLSPRLDELHATRTTVTMLGTVPKTSLEQWQTENVLGDLCEITQISTERELAYVYLLMHRSCQEKVARQLKVANFMAVTLPALPQTAAEQISELEAEKTKLAEKQKELTDATAALSGELAPLQQLFDLLNAHQARLAAARSFSQSERTFFMQGWIPAHLTDHAEKRLKKVSPTVALEFYDPAEEEEPPVILQNAPMVKPFESVVTGFSLPSPYGIDPTAVMMPFFINFMGMMISDAGYGLMMAILMPLLIKILKPAPSGGKMLWLLAAGGIATTFWGAMYNSWFGYAPFPSLLDPMNNALPVMGLCIGLGAIHLFTGLGLAAYLNIRRGHPLDAVADQLSWFLLIIGLALLAVVPSVGKWMAITGAAIIVVFAGRAKSKNPIKRLISGLGALYGVTSWLSDLLSYIRLFGMGLATGVIGMVINILVGIVSGFGPVGIVAGVLVFIAGHLFNAGINIFGAYVHSCRLQYIEFFGKFYEDGGKPFLPLSRSARYVRVEDAPQA